MLSAIREACEACVKQEKEERDGILASIEQAKVCVPSALARGQDALFFLRTVSYDIYLWRT